ncbi:MAG: ParB/RepB/Spo0J family partition protein [Rhodospirillales bacterium]|jgi:ParB family chromosome partitioning protein|nr:ParB/RepB/Spo0J family partition protein [Rhodospirillales bacterium]
MADAGKRQNLGRGLSALLGDDPRDDEASARGREYRTVPIEFLRPGRHQPRRTFDDDEIANLAQSIREKGVLQPILVRHLPDDENAFEIIAGERRWRAAQVAQVHEVPVVVKDLSDGESLEIALVENLQRQDLSALEEAEGYHRLIEDFSHTQEDLGRVLGKSRSHVANMIRLLGLPDPVKTLLDTRALSAGHARALLNATDPIALARKVVNRGLNVRQTEALVRDGHARSGRAHRPEARAADTVALERDLSNLLGLKVRFKFSGAGGTLTLHYASLEQLDDILHRLSEGVHGEALKTAHEVDPANDEAIGTPGTGANPRSGGTEARNPDDDS